MLERLCLLIEPIVETRFIIRSRPDLAAALRRQGVPFNPDLPPATWLHNLLKKRHRALTDLSSTGVDIRPQWQHLSLAELADEMDTRLLELCDAHLSRYFFTPDDLKKGD